MIELRYLLEQVVKRGASDLHLTVGIPPQFRIDGKLVPAGKEILTPEMTQHLAYSILTDQQKKRFEMENELDLSFSIRGLSRFRANIYLQRGCIAVAIRAIPFEIRSFEELGLPKVVEELAAKPKGLILVTGPTGCGKSTTLAAMIDKINRERHAHIVTIEDPIEYLHHHQKSIVNQRQVDSDTKSFANALKYVLRQDPDVVMIGEMRDLETITQTLTIAETGHLVLATLHTNSAAESINRITDVFPSHQQPQVRAQLSFVLEGVIAQQLIPRHGGGRVLALEIMVCTTAIRAVIRDNKIHQIYGIMQASSKYGMQTMNQSLYNLYITRKISFENAISRSYNPEELTRMLDKQSYVPV